MVFVGELKFTRFMCDGIIDRPCIKLNVHVLLDCVIFVAVYGLSSIEWDFTGV
jgi:hypothetical protein